MHFKPKSDFIKIMHERGFVQDSTDISKLDDLFNSEEVVAYIGYDATGKSLHVGHLVPIMMLRWLQKCGHTPITLIGGGTTKIGDPSFRSEDRPILEEEDINKKESKDTVKNKEKEKVNSEIEDYQLNRAIELIRSINVYESIKKAAS
jgi:tyrosyl-tRNA synthetase